MSRQELAEAINQHLWTTYQTRDNLDRGDIGAYERGEIRWPNDHRREAFRAILGATHDHQLGFYTGKTPQPANASPVASQSANVDVDVSLFSSPGSGAPDGTVSAASGLDALAGALAGYRPPDTALSVPSADELVAATSEGKRLYQAGSYDNVVATLPPLLFGLRLAGEPPAARLAADAYQLACSVLIKLGDVPLTVLAADRSMAAAQTCGEPLAIGSSARAVIHALLAAGHHRQATDLGVDAAQRLGDAVDLSDPVAQSVYGALLLRAAVAAAAGEDRATAIQLLEEANDGANRLGHDANRYWTFFGPTNVTLHRVGVAASLGDAGHAIDHARRVDLARVPLAERRACLFVDVARAFAQWGKYDQAYHALCAAETSAPQEVKRRPAVHRIVLDLEQRSPAATRSRVQAMARRIGAFA